MIKIDAILIHQNIINKTDFTDCLRHRVK